MIRKQIMALTTAYPWTTTEDSIRVAKLASDIAEAREAELLAQVEQYKLKAMENQGMADCMDMVMQELEGSGIIPKGIAPMFVPEAIKSHISRREHNVLIPSISSQQYNDEVYKDIP